MMKNWLLGAGAAFLLLGGQLAVADEKPFRQSIDAELRAGYQRESVTPAGPANDAAFLRRVFLDLVATIPTYEEAVKFLDDKTEDKREKLVDRLLADPRYARNQAAVWDLVMFGRNPPDPDLTRRREGFQKWLTEQFANNVPYDRWVRDLLLAEGYTDEGPAMFYALFVAQPEEAAESVSRLFLGTQLRCARCHDHPYEKWKQEDFYGLAGFFVRMTYVPATRNNKCAYLVAEKSSGDVMFTGSVKDQRPGQKGKPVPPRFLGGDLLEEPPLPASFKEPDFKTAKTPPPPLFSRKAKLAEWITAPDNPYFARAVANRVWAQLMGRGFIHPVDDLGSKKKPSHPELLQMMTDQLVAHQFDLKWLIREIVNSQGYQLAGTGQVKDATPYMYERARIRPLSLEEITAAIRTASGFDNTDAKPEQGKLPGSEYMLFYFSEPTDGRGDFQASLSEHLYLNNSTQLRSVIQRRKGNLADLLLSSTAPWDERVERLFLSVLSRPPRPEEKKKFAAYLSAKPDAGPLVEDAIWVLMNCAEFRFNH